MGTKSILHGKLQYSIAVVLIYLLGRTIPLPFVEVDNGSFFSMGLQGFINSAMGNTVGQNSILTLGFMPYMTSGIVLQVIQLSSGGDSKRTSPKTIYKLTLFATLAVAILQGVIRSWEMQLQIIPGISNILVRVLVVLEMVAGTFVVVHLAEQNSVWGIGGQSLLIFINVLDGLRGSLMTWAMELGGGEGDVMSKFFSTILVLALVGMTILLTVAFERGEWHEQVKRLSIDNAFAEDSYIAIKMNPVGSMPVMYGMAFFSLPVYLLYLIDHIKPGIPFVTYWIQNLNLDSISGLLIFAAVLFLLTFALSNVYINPRDASDDLKKNGDYIVDVKPGKDTKRYLAKTITFASVASSLMMSLVVIGPMIYKVSKHSSSQIFMLPMSIMIMTSILLNILDEIKMLKVFEKYKPFL